MFFLKFELVGFTFKKLDKAFKSSLVKLRKMNLGMKCNGAEGRRFEGGGSTDSQSLIDCFSLPFLLTNRLIYFYKIFLLQTSSLCKSTFTQNLSSFLLPSLSLPPNPFQEIMFLHNFQFVWYREVSKASYKLLCYIRYELEILYDCFKKEVGKKGNRV